MNNEVSGLNVLYADLNKDHPNSLVGPEDGFLDLFLDGSGPADLK